MHNYMRDTVVVLLDGEGTDVWGGCDQCGAFWDGPSDRWHHHHWRPLAAAAVLTATELESTLYSTVRWKWTDGTGISHTGVPWPGQTGTEMSQMRRAVTFQSGNNDLEHSECKQQQTIRHRGRYVMVTATADTSNWQQDTATSRQNDCNIVEHTDLTNQRTRNTHTGLSSSQTL